MRCCARNSPARQVLRALANLPVCTVVMESCAGAHWLARQIQALGHTVKLIAPQYVKPFVQGNKNDFLDAQAICEAASRPSMRFVAIKNVEQRTLSAIHRLRDALVSQRTAAINQVHGFLLESGEMILEKHQKIPCNSISNCNCMTAFLKIL